MVAGREADEPCHPDVEGVVPFDVLLAAQRMDYRRSEFASEPEHFVMRPGATGSAQ
jgi:hypothetical protein